MPKQSMRSVVNAIDKQGFNACISFVKEQFQVLGVADAGTDDLNDLLTSWSRHIAEGAANSWGTFNIAYAGVSATNAHAAYKTQQKLRDRLNGKRWLNISLVKNDDNGMVSAIQAHPFYVRFQKSGLDAADNAVRESYKLFKQVDDYAKQAGVKLDSLHAKLNALEEPNLGLDDVIMPDQILNPKIVGDSINRTAQLLRDRDARLFNSAAALAAVADAVAKEIYADWCQALVLLDVALSRYYTIAYFGILMDTAVSLIIARQALPAMQFANAAELGELLKLVSSVAKDG